MGVSGSTGKAGASPGWLTSGTQLTISASPTANDVFTFWNGTGTGSYSGSSATQTITVSAPISEVAAFVPPVPVTLHEGGFFSTTTAWIVLAVVGLAIGLGAGMMAFRGRGRAPPPSREASEPAVSELPGTEPGGPSTPEMTEESTTPEYVEDQGGDQ